MTARRAPTVARARHTMDFLKDIFNPIKITSDSLKSAFVAGKLREGLNFILDVHVKDNEVGEEGLTLLDKMQRIMELYLKDRLDKDSLYDLFGCKLDLKREQFDYLHEKIKQDVSINHIIKKIVGTLEDTEDHREVKQRLANALEDDGFTYIASFLIRECNNAVKYIN